MVAAVLTSDWCQKTFVFFCPIRRENFHTLLKQAYFLTINIIIIIIIIIVIVPSKARCEGIKYYNFGVRNIVQNDVWNERGS